MRAPSHAAVLAALLALAAGLPAQGPAATPANDFAVHCGRLLLGDGHELANAWLLVRGGKVVGASTEAPPAEMAVVDCTGKVVMPGIVAADSDLSGAGDSEYNVTPDALAIDGFDFARNQQQALMGGVTTVYLSPGRERLIAGQGAVVKLHGADEAARVLRESSCLRVNLGDGSVNAPRVFEPTAHPTTEDPLLPARVQMPTARISQLQELRALFAAATDRKVGLQGQGADENHYSEQAIAAVVTNGLPLRAGASKAADVRRALLLAKELGLRAVVLENPFEIGPLAKDAAAQGAMASFRVPVLLGAGNPGGEDRRQKYEPRLEAPGKAAAAGMTIALVPQAGVPWRDFLMAAAVAVRHGLDAGTALRAVTGDAAKVLGVQDRVGTLLPGHDADFVVLSGDPLAVGSLVESTWIDGRQAYVRKAKGSLLAVRCGRILDAEGHVFRSGVILAENGRIKAVGEDLAIPFGARVIDLPNGVMTPGFLDAFSHLGLAGDGTPVPPGAPNQKLDLAIAHDDPMFLPAVQAGLTTVLVSGKDQGQLAGRIAAVKTAAADQEHMVVRRIAGQRFLLDAVGPDAVRPLAEQLQRAKGYRQAFADHEKALAEWKAGKKVEAPPPPPPSSTPPPEDPVSGTWEANIDLQGRVQLKVILELKLAGTTVTGKVRISFGNREAPGQDITSGSFQDGKLKIEFKSGQGGGNTTTVEADLKGDEMTGKVTLGQLGDQAFTGKRTAKDAGGTPARTVAATGSGDKDKNDGPKPPPIDEGLEPLRQCLDKKATLVVRTSRGPTIKAIVELLQKEQVPFVLQGGDSLLDEPDLLGSSRPGILLEPDVVRDQDGELRNAAAVFADRGHPVVLGSGDCAGARFLPLHAAYAVRYGMSPDDALLALTHTPAVLFQLDDRIGSLRKGKDADFVVFTGHPFEPQSRILLVVVDGEVVVDRRESNQ